MTDCIRLETGINDDGRRLDRILRKACPSLPISAIHRLLRKGFVLLDGRRAEPSSRVQSGQFIEIRGADIVPAECGAWQMPPGGSAAASPIGTQIAILYEGDGILALNKNAGIAVQEELTPFVRAYLDGKIERSLSFTPGPLHRLDRGASGIIVFGSSLAGARSFSALMQTGLLKKKYLALLEGRLTGAQVWRDNLEYNNAARKTRVYGVDAADDKKNAKYAETCIVPLEYGDGLTVADVEIATGRTHQIRAQAAAHGFPLYGDRKYGSKNPPPFFLHACRLDFPSGCPFPPSITAPPPSAFLDRVKGLTLMV